MKKILITEKQDRIIQEAIAEKRLLPNLPLFISDAIKNGNTPLSKCPAFLNGTLERLMLKSFKSAVEEFSDDITSYTEVEITNALSKLTTKIIKKEEKIKPQLENLCLKIVQETLGVPQEGVKIGCELLSEIPEDGRFKVQPQENDEKIYDDITSMEDSNSEIEKRKLLYAFITGMANKVSEDARKKYIGEIFDIDEELPHLYSKVMKINDYLLFISNPVIDEHNHKQGGYVDVKLGTDLVPTEITAHAIMFPILLYETFKGCLELFISHGLPDDMDSAKEILDKADVLVNDPWYMRVGGALYQHEIPTKNIPTFLMNLSETPTREFFEMSKEIIVGTKKGEAIIQKLISDAEYNDGYDTFQNDLVQKQGGDKELVTDDYFTEQELEEAAYPSNFNMEEFKLLTSFAARVRYCAERLPRLGSGSARIVYKIDEGTVLKLAKNGKGIAQNEIEGGDYYLRNMDLFPEVYDCDDNYLWIEMQMARRAKPSDFPRLCGYNFKTVCEWVRRCSYRARGERNGYHQIFDEDDFLSKLRNGDLELFSQLEDYIGSYLDGRATGDLQRLSSWGVIRDEHGERLVVIDYGFNEEVFNDYYKKW